jgi:hypothetical protein
MKRTSTLALMGTAFVVAFGLLGFNGVLTNTFVTQYTDPTSIKDGIHSLGHVVAVLKDPDGTIKAYRQSDNIVVTTGKNCMVDDTFGSTGSCANKGAAFNYIAIGTGSNAQSTTDTNLVNQLTRTVISNGGPALIAASSTVGAKATESALFTIGQPTTIQEAGLFDTGGTAGDMFAEEGFAGISATGGDQLTITWTVTTG